MRFPNSYGSVIKLSGKRRKPYAVRITVGIKMVNNRARQDYKYLGYFEKKSDAVTYLAQYNEGIEIHEHRSLKETPTFAEVYERWMEECENTNKGIGESTRRSRQAAFKRLSAIHDRKVVSLRHADVQPIITANRQMSKSTVSNMITVCHAVADYAIKYDLATIDFSAHLSGEFREKTEIHHPFTADEIRLLWKDSDNIAARFALITIYTGLRPSEALRTAFSEEDIERHYCVTGMKTEAGRDRVVPIHNDIIPLVKDWDSKIKRLSWFREKYWNPYMESHSMDHKPHDGRHTCATLMESAGVPLNRRKLILGHKVTDITDGVYTHVSPEDLVEEINKIKP